MALNIQLPLLLLLVLGMGLAWFDLKTRRVPNRVTLLLLGAGFVINFPGNFNLWLTSYLVIFAWLMQWMGGGDAKLWLALLWLSPLAVHNHLPILFGSVFLITGLGQLIWRRQKRKPLLGVSTPGAWRALPFIAMLIWLGGV